MGSNYEQTSRVRENSGYADLTGLLLKAAEVIRHCYLGVVEGEEPDQIGWAGPSGYTDLA